MDKMPAHRELPSDPRRASHYLGSCFLLAWLVACSSNPFTVAASGGADAAGGSSAGHQNAAGGRADASSETHGSPRAGAPSAGSGAAGSGSGGVDNDTVNRDPELGGAFGGAAESAAGGAAGSAPEPALPCHQGTSRDYQLKFYSENQGDIEQELHPFFELLSANGKSLPLNRVKLRYYYTKEADGSELGSCFWVTGDRCSLVKFEFSDLVPATSNANRVMEVSFSDSTVAVGLTPLEVRTGLTVNHANLEQRNDYSFLPSASALVKGGPATYSVWDHVTLYVDDELVWGAEPCPSND